MKKVQTTLSVVKPFVGRSKSTEMRGPPLFYTQVTFQKTYSTLLHFFSLKYCILRFLAEQEKNTGGPQFFVPKGYHEIRGSQILKPFLVLKSQIGSKCFLKSRCSFFSQWRQTETKTKCFSRIDFNPLCLRCA